MTEANVFLAIFIGFALAVTAGVSLAIRHHKATWKDALACLVIVILLGVGLFQFYARAISNEQGHRSHHITITFVARQPDSSTTNHCTTTPFRCASWRG